MSHIPGYPPSLRSTLSRKSQHRPVPSRLWGLIYMPEGFSSHLVDLSVSCLLYHHVYVQSVTRWSHSSVHLLSSHIRTVCQSLAGNHHFEHLNIIVNLLSTPIALTARSHRPPPITKMCDFVKNFYIYSSCTDPGTHFFKTSVDGSRENACPQAPHERYIVQQGTCPLCSQAGST